MLGTEDIFIILITGELIVGILGNGYIVLVNCIDWMKKKSISSFDYLLTTLAISRIFLIGTMVLNGIILVLYPDIYRNNSVQTLLCSAWTFFNYLSMCLATCLNVFYLVKVADFSHSLFLWLKWRIDKMVHQIVLGCFAICLLVGLIAVILMSYNMSYLSQRYKSTNTKMFNVSKSQYFEPITLFNLFAMIPFIVSLISVFFLILSLGRHVKQMKLKATGYRDPSTEAHVRAMKMITSFLVFLFVYCVFSLLISFSYFLQDQKSAIMFGEIITILYPLGHSFMLIVGNNKLRQAPVRLLLCRKIVDVM
ncbi:taste receptor type 2 member 8 [Perognathus longimembris pacificus]|uniref:taste receptor type 2 member 8 n=1 Tax=Perognathus longimembris pacificus TaxID=214514 RepID=UPI002018991F|nr:taste receptor type 2 member 8 [Perognathus longimembris pacificus]